MYKRNRSSYYKNDSECWIRPSFPLQCMQRYKTNYNRAKMKLILIIVVAVVAVMAENRGKHRTVPSYKIGSGSYEKEYETATPFYQLSKSGSSYQEEPVYTKSYSRSSYAITQAPSTVKSNSYSMSSYEPSTYSTAASAYVTKPKSYRIAEPVRSYSSNPTYSESYATTTSAPKQQYSTRTHYSKQQDSYNYKPMSYSFAWGVKDEKSYNNYSHQQESNGKVVTGFYRVALPDGRTQIVSYRADEYGYQAEVKYEGQAKYDEYKPTANL